MKQRKKTTVLAVILTKALMLAAISLLYAWFGYMVTVGLAGG